MNNVPLNSIWCQVPRVSLCGHFFQQKIVWSQKPKRQLHKSSQCRCYGSTTSIFYSFSVFIYCFFNSNLTSPAINLSIQNPLYSVWKIGKKINKLQIYMPYFSDQSVSIPLPIFSQTSKNRRIVEIYNQKVILWF